MVSIAVGMMIMDNRKYLEETFIPYFKKFEKNHPRIKLSYFFRENDSCDYSNVVLERFLKHRSGKLLTSAKESLEKTASFVSPEAGQRMHKLAMLRTQLNDLIPHEQFDYVLFMDSDIIFESKVIDNFLKIMQEHPKIGKVTANGVIRGGIWEGLYYDTWACDFLDGTTPHGHSRYPSKFPVGCCSDKIKNVYAFVIPEDHPHLIKVKSAFGGAAMIRAHLCKDFVWSAEGSFNYVNLGRVLKRSAQCEHKSFCEHIREAGYLVVIDPASTCTWTREVSPIKRKYLERKDKIPYRAVSVIGDV